MRLENGKYLIDQFGVNCYEKAHNEIEKMTDEKINIVKRFIFACFLHKIYISLRAQNKQQ